jgi:ribosomal silencing factor RsfS
LTTRTIRHANHSLCNSARWFSSGQSDDKNSETNVAAAGAAEWIAPSRPLVGDLGQSHLYVKKNEMEEEDEELELQRIERELEKLNVLEQHVPTATSAANTVDWLATRRSKLSMSPSLENELQTDSISVKRGMFLSSLEIKKCLESQGGQDVIIAKPTEAGAGYILVTANTNHLLRSLADTLVRHLRQRDLHLMGVVGAELGVEGADDPTETWLVVDAGTYVIHLQDARTRKAVNLEALWFGTDKLRRVNAHDEEAVETYIAENPVPEDYNVSWSRDWDETMKDLQKQRWTVPRHRPVTVKPKTKSRTRRKISR